MRVLVALFLLFTSFNALSVDVPSTIYFAGMELHLTSGLQRKLQADLELIMKSPKGFQTKVDRANLHFPIIERALKEEGVTDEYKFLVLQESSLVSDAVSTSNAVGYCQFKKETAIEVGLRVDASIDERMHLIASVKGLARYMKKNNTTLQNWVYALLAYNTGLGGAKSYIENKYIGANKMTLDENTHWYIIRFLAHKLAYENAIGKDMNPALVLATYEKGSGKTLREIANETEINIDNLVLNNKWLLQNRIPGDYTSYPVLLPLSPAHKQVLIEKKILSPSNEPLIAVVKETKDNHKEEKKTRKERVSEYKGTLDIALVTNVNRIKAIKAKEGDTPAKLAIQGGIALDDFLRYNDLKSYESIVPGKIYFLQPKRKKAAVMYHTVQDGETLKEISQLYGIKIKAIRTKNRMEKNEALEQGRVLWLRSKRPEDIPVELKEVEKVVPVEEKPVLEKNEVPTPEPKIPPVVINGTSSNNVKVENLHEVKPGETLYGISRLHSVAVDSIKVWNNLPDNSIQPGMKLVVKSEQPEVKETFIEHVVLQGETLYQISKKYNVKVDDILIWNSKKDSSVSIGEKLIIKK